jgi:hypothetical protein
VWCRLIRRLSWRGYRLGRIGVGQVSNGSWSACAVEMFLADCDDQAGRVLGRARTTTHEPEVVVVLLSSFCLRAGSPMMRSRENLSHRASD